MGFPCDIRHVEFQKQVTMEQPKFQFPLINVTKYAKSHYKKSGHFWYDIALCLHADSYGHFFGYDSYSKKTPQEESYRQRMTMSQLIIGKMLPIFNTYRIEETIKTASPQECYVTGCRFKGGRFNSPEEDKTLPEYEYWEAMLRAYLSVLSQTTAQELGYDNWEPFNEDNIPELKK